MQEIEPKKTPAKYKVLIENEILNSIKKRKALKQRFTTERKATPEKTFAREPKIHKIKSQSTLFQFPHSSIFNTSHKRLSSKLLRREVQAQSTSKIRIKKSEAEKQQRVDSLENLMQKCKKINSEFQSSRVVHSYNQINSNLNKLKNSIDRFKVSAGDLSSSLHTDKLLRSDSKIIRSQLTFTEKLKKKHKSIWKFSLGSMKKKTEKIIATVDNRFFSKDTILY